MTPNGIANATDDYARYRPNFPTPLYTLIIDTFEPGDRGRLLDLGAGNITHHFEADDAVDIEVRRISRHLDDVVGYLYPTSFANRATLGHRPRPWQRDRRTTDPSHRRRTRSYSSLR